MRESSYERLRNSATGEGAEAWKAADREAVNLASLYNELKEDPRYTDEHKAQTAWAAYDRAAPKVTDGRAKAKELLQKQARTAERFSLPFPEGEGPTTADTSKLLASQNEASRIVRRIDRMRGDGKGPFKTNPAEVLRTEYGRGLEVGGVQGGAICRGVLSAADELGIDRESVVGGHRKDRHRESLERAQHSERLAFTIGGKAPEPPFPRPGAKGRGSEPTRRGALLLPGRETIAANTSRRRPPWK